MTTTPLDLYQKIQRIQFISTHLATDILAGAYKSAFKGRGMEFEEVREYEPGDEIRSIDWNVTARMNHPYVKNFREERDLTVMLAVDISASSHFGSSEKKSAIITELAAVLAFSAIKSNDRVGLLLFSDEIELFLPPRKGTRHVLQLVRELLVLKPKHNKTDISKALSFIGKVQNRSSICFLISDFFCSDYSHEANLISKKHDLIAISVTDPYEYQFPDMGLVNLVDLESGEHGVVDTSDNNVQSHFKIKSEEHLTSVHQLMKKIGAGFIDIRTDVPYILPLRKFFKLRMAKRK